MEFNEYWVLGFIERLLLSLLLPENGVDFMVAIPATVTFSDGAVSGDTECLSIPIINDNDFEGDHSFQAQLSAVEPANVPITLDGTLAAIIVKDDNGETNFSCILM